MATLLCLIDVITASGFVYAVQAVEPTINQLPGIRFMIIAFR
jgi:hypothetical protein